MAFSVRFYTLYLRGSMGVWCNLRRGAIIPSLNAKANIICISVAYKSDSRVELPPMHKPYISNVPEYLKLLKLFSSLLVSAAANYSSLFGLSSVDTETSDFTIIVSLSSSDLQI